MKRYIFFFLLLGAILVSTFFAVCGDAGFDAGIERLEALIEKIFDLSLFKLGFTTVTIPIYGLLIFLFINVILVISLLLMLLINSGRLSRALKFYSSVTWFFIGAIFFTGAFVYSIAYTIYDATGSFNGVFDVLVNTQWHQYLPIISSFVLLIVSIIFRNTESAY